MSERLKAAMAALGLNETQAADRFTVSRQAVNQWLNSKSRMRRVHLRTLGRLERDAAKRTK